MLRMSRLAAAVLPVLLVLGFAPAPAHAATINPTVASFRGWVNAGKTGGATYDTYPWDNHRLTGDCKALGNINGGTYCQVHWGLFQGTSYTVCTTSTAAGWVGYASYWMPGMAASATAELFAVGAPGAATFEGFIPDVTGILMHLKIDAAAACAALKVLKADPYADTIPNGFTGTLEQWVY